MIKKQKLIVCILILVAGGIFSLLFTTILHKLLSREISVIQFIPIGQCIKSLITNNQHRMMFLCFLGFTGILTVMYYLTNQRPYQSDLDEITPDIQTPKAVGQYQHGSSRWLKEKEYVKVFDSFELGIDDQQVKELMKHGNDDLDFIKREGE